MKSISCAVLLCLLLTSVVVGADQTLLYEPAVIEVAGSLKKGTFKHPNGELVGFYALKLKTPADINADGVNTINVSEKGVEEIQLYSNIPETMEQFKNLTGKEVVATGTLFHSHTAWHVRPLIMNVSELK